MSIYFFDTGLYFPKVSLVAFYWWLIPQGFRRLRYAVYATTAIVVACFVASILCDTLLAPNISDNWYDFYPYLDQVVLWLTSTFQKVYREPAQLNMEYLHQLGSQLDTQLWHRSAA